MLKSLCIAFSTYSKIPVPQFPWEEKDMKYMLCFFPWVGIVTGLLFYGWRYLCSSYGIGTCCYALVGTAIPILVSGGFHADGFMDTMDALHSYQSREKKLEILKDSHVGAFAVIMTVLYYLLYAGFLSEVRSMQGAAVAAVGFFVSRCLSGLTVVTFPQAREKGSLHTVASGSEKKTVKCVLVVELVLGLFLLLWFGKIPGILGILFAFCMLFYYRKKTDKEFGGITGDTAGYFLQLLELGFVMAAAFTDIAARWYFA